MEKSEQRARWEPDYRDLVEKAGDAIYTLDLEGRFTYGNEAALRNLGYDQTEYDELLGQHFLDFLTPASREHAIDHFMHGLAQDTQSPYFEVQAFHKDGTIIDFEIRGSNLYRDGELVGRQGFIRNISEIKRLQAVVAETSARLELLEERERMASVLYNRFAILASSSSTPAEMQALEAALSSVTARRFGLDRSDIEVLGLLAQGLTNREIAEEIHLSPHTIKDRVGRILRSMDASSRAEAVAIAIRNGLIQKQSH